jgi:hypothetical protein
VLVNEAAELFQEEVSLREVLTRGAFALEQIRHGVDAEAVDAVVEPERDDLKNFRLNGWIVVVQVGLM